MSLSYYKILGVETSASQAEIKKAYFGLIKIHHPDSHGDQNDPISRLINEAYETLGDPGKRKKYDSRIYRRSEKDQTNDTDRECKNQRSETTESRQQTNNSDGQREKQTRKKEDVLKNTRAPCSKCGGEGRVYTNKQGIFYSSSQSFSVLCRYCEGSGEEPSPVSLPAGRSHCKRCDGFGKIEGNDLIWLRCGHCKGKGLEPIPVDLPPNREHCISCKGYGGHLKINNIIFAGIQNEIWMICLECRGTGLKPQHSPGNKRFFKI